MNGFGRLFRLLGLVAVGSVVFSAFTPVPNAVGRWLGASDRIGRADAIVVLGAGVRSNGELNDGSLRRALSGIDLYRRGLAPLLAFCGPDRGISRPEAEIRADLAREMGIPPEAILTDIQARTTREEALRLGKLLRAKGARRILLVTDALHMVRGRRLFEREGLEVLPSASHEISLDESDPENRLLLVRGILKELMARLYYRVAGYL